MFTSFTVEANNLWVLFAGLLVFLMTIAVGFLEVGELGEDHWFSLLKTTYFTGIALTVMAIVGFNTAFAPTWHGILGNPFYQPGFFLGAFSSSSVNPTQGVWWSVASPGLTPGVYFLFETAFAAVTLALVGVVFFRKVKLAAIVAYSVVYFVLIWNLPAAWIWNPSGWLAKLGMVDFAGGLVVHGAAGAAGLGVMYQIWREERARGATASPAVPIRISPGWLTLGILLLWLGWFGFNPGSVLAFNNEAIVVVLTTFVAAAVGLLSFSATTYVAQRKAPDLLAAVNGILMGLIVITPLAGFVSPGSAIVLGAMCGPVFYLGELLFARFRWFTDPVGLLPGHLLGGVFGVSMIAFFTQTAFALPAGAPASLPNGLLFGGGMSAVHQLGLEEFGIAVVLVIVFVLSFVTAAILARALGGITQPDAASAGP
ncbi:MAG TPA: ammonium transporter [Thermoplasmata archaeon]|nr:ammonium transporter [Thermoplasmata archaeon]